MRDLSHARLHARELLTFVIVSVSSLLAELGAAAEFTAFSRPASGIQTRVSISGSGFSSIQSITAPAVDNNGNPFQVVVGPLVFNSSDTLVDFVTRPYQVTGPLTLHFSGGTSLVTPVFVIRTAADFTADHRADILWRDPNGGVGYWDLVNGELSEGRFLGDVPEGMTFAGDGDLNAGGALPPLPAGYSIAGIADMNRDGKEDIVIRDSSGGVGVWLMNGVSVIGGGFIGTATPDFALAAVDDFTGEGDPDILFTDASGFVGLWILDGLTISRGAALGPRPAGMQIIGVHGFNGDTNADIYFRDAPSGSGQMVWYVVDPGVSKFSSMTDPAASLLSLLPTTTATGRTT